MSKPANEAWEEVRLLLGQPTTEAMREAVETTAREIAREEVGDLHKVVDYLDDRIDKIADHLGLSIYDPSAPSEGSDDTEGMEVVARMRPEALGSRGFLDARLTPPSKHLEDLVRLSDAVAKIAHLRRGRDKARDAQLRIHHECQGFKARLESVERERDQLKDMHRTMCDVAKSRYFEIEKLEAELRQRKEGNEGPEGEVEPVAYISVSGRRELVDKGATVANLSRRSNKVFCIPLYSHETVQRLQRRASEFERMYRNRDGRLEEARAEIARLRDPKNWKVVRNQAEMIERIEDQFTIRYVGPESEGESDYDCEPLPPIDSDDK